MPHSFCAGLPDLGKFWRVLQWKTRVYFTDIWYILRPFGIFYGHLGNFRYGLPRCTTCFLSHKIEAGQREAIRGAKKFTGCWFNVFMLTLSYFPPAETFHRRKFAKVGKALLDTFFSQFLRHLRHASSKIRIHQLLESTILWRLSQ
jgi:hypothetical protein